MNADQFADALEGIRIVVGRTVCALRASCEAFTLALRRAWAAVRRWVWLDQGRYREILISDDPLRPPLLVFIFEQTATPEDRTRLRQSWRERQRVPAETGTVEDLTLEQLRASLGGDGASLTSERPVRFNSEGGFYHPP
jgi:hypothetical protein